MLYVEFKNRDFSDYPSRHWEKIVVEKYSKAAVGGCLNATISAYGSEDDLWQFVEMLRCGITIHDDERAKPVWWGYISKVEVFSNTGVRYGVDLYPMYNEVRATYTEPENETTDWATDTISETAYGTKQLTLSATDKDKDEAENYRDIELERLKYPARLPLIFNKDQEIQARAVLHCKGWWSTANWKYYPYTGYIDAWEAIDEYEGHKLTGLTDFEFVTQLIFPDENPRWEAAWTPNEVWIRVRKTGSPTDTVTVELWSYDGDPVDPVAKLSDCTAYTDNVEDTEFQWWRYTIDTPFEFAVDGGYFIKTYRSGASNGTHYWWVGMSPNNVEYPGSIYEYWGPLQTFAETYTYVMNFRCIIGSIGTDLITDLITDGYPELIVGADIVDASVNYPSSIDRTSSSSVMYEIKELLKIGTANNRRLLALVTPERLLQVYEEPAAYDNDKYIDAFGMLSNELGNPIPKADCSVGYWAFLKGIIPATVNISQLASATHIFVEEAEYNALNDTYEILKSRDSFDWREYLIGEKGNNSVTTLAKKLAPHIRRIFKRRDYDIYGD